jgi:hypothetical protein
MTTITQEWKAIEYGAIYEISNYGKRFYGLIKVSW